MNSIEEELEDFSFNKEIIRNELVETLNDVLPTTRIKMTPYIEGLKKLIFNSRSEIYYLEHKYISEYLRINGMDENMSIRGYHLKNTLKNIAYNIKKWLKDNSGVEDMNNVVLYLHVGDGSYIQYDGDKHIDEIISVYVGYKHNTE